MVQIIEKLLGRRRNFFINPSFQLRFMGFMIFGLILSIMSFYVADIYFFNSLVAFGKQKGLEEGHIYFQLIKEQHGLLNNIFVVSRMIVFCIVLVSSLFLSHRVAGPLYHLNNFLKKATNSDNLEDLEKLKFRKRDFFKELPESVNQFIASRKIKGSTTEQSKNDKLTG
ncbi:MAG: hypothetical protein ISR65_08535 [Bacteriovoracaceae bacterium]|nr:hypothetical protein [Bacteriovoracaceae bacterium]